MLHHARYIGFNIAQEILVRINDKYVCVCVCAVLPVHHAHTNTSAAKTV